MSDTLDIGIEYDDETNSDTEMEIDSNISIKVINEVINESDKLTNNQLIPSYDSIMVRCEGMITNNKLYEMFKKPYIICLKDYKQYRSYFYNNKITEENYDTLKESIEIIPTSYKINSGSMSKYMTSISGDLFNQLSNTKTDLKEILVFSLFRFNYTNIMKYLRQYDGLTNITDLYSMILMNEYFGQSNNFNETKYNISQMINTISETNYYALFRNCMINITDKFNTRVFKLSLANRIDDINIEDIIKSLDNNDDDYLADITKPTTFLDASSSNNIDGNNKYRISNKVLKITNEHINSLFDRLSYADRYYLIMNCMTSKELCHLIINNKVMLNRIMNEKDNYNKTFMNKYAHIIRYGLGYAWITFYMEESIKRSNITSKDRFIFDIDTASLLPYYPYSLKNLHLCPYISLLVDNKSLNTEQNIFGVKQYNIDLCYPEISPESKQKLNYGICNKETFINRINIFMSGMNNVNMIENIDWANIAISGSVMACCLPNFNSLMMNFMNIDRHNVNIDFIKFIDEYYKDADIDIMCSILDVYKYVDKILEFKKQLEQNIKKIHNLNLPSCVDITQLFSNKAASVMINKNFVKKYILDNTDMKYENILINLNDNKIKTIVYDHYIQWFKEYISNDITNNNDNFLNPKYHELYIPVTIDNINVVLVTNKYKTDYTADSTPDNTPDNISDDNSDIIIFIPKTNYKFRIKSAYLPRNLEFFQIRGGEFFSTVSKFHLPIVRSYFDGNNVYMCPSCITACMTFVNIDYKYFAGSKDPIEIVNKYRMRGFGTILNDSEINRLVKYSMLVPKWKKLYKNKNNITGSLPFNNQFFLPSHHLDGKPLFNANNRILYGNGNVIQIADDINEYIRYIDQKYSTKYINNDFISYHNLVTIDDYGYINRIKKWLFQAFLDY